MSMNFTPLQRFVDEELARAPLFADEALQATLEALARTQREGPYPERGPAADVARAVFDHRSRLVTAYTQTVLRLVQDEWRRETATPGSAAATAAAAPSSAARRGAGVDLDFEPLSRRMGLELVDENHVAQDVAQAAALEALRTVAEHEIRELATFTAALVGDMDVARDWNPLRPETQAKALWAMAQALPQHGGLPLAFMRAVATPFAHCLRKAYAAACTRLEDAGVEPAVCRTLILPRGPRRARAESTLDQMALAQIQLSLPDIKAGLVASADAASSESASALSAAPSGGNAPAPAGAFPSLPGTANSAASAERKLDATALDVLGRLFDTLLGDRRLAAKSSLARLQPLALRLAAREPALLDDFTHPLWRLMDQIAWQAELLLDAPAQRQRFIDKADQLLEHLAGEPEQNAGLYHWALQRLAAAERFGNEQRLRAHSARLRVLGEQDRRLAAGETPTEPAALTVGQLETVPDALMGGDPLKPSLSTEAQAVAWLDERQPGAWWRLFVDGAWQQMQLLWVGPQREAWLLAWASDSADETDALAFQRKALLRLREAGLAHERKPRSLVRDAAEYLLRKAASSRRAAPR
jgi:hypothetical protein